MKKISFLLSAFILFFCFAVSAQHTTTRETKVAVTAFTLKADNAQELSNFDWESLKTIFSSNTAEDVIKMIFAVGDEAKLDHQPIEKFTFSVSGKTSELNKMVMASQKVIARLETVEKK